MRLFRYLILVCLLAGWLQVAPVQAQTTHWNERRTLQFAILYPDGAEPVAEQYAQFVDGIFEETSTWWGYRAVTPIILRIYPTMELYIQSNPLAAQIPGVIAHAHTGRREISVALPQTATQTPDEIANNVRHELTHIVAADLSGGKLTTMWQEGIAQNAEHPGTELTVKMQLMQQAIARNQVVGWDVLNQPGAAYANPQLSYPESYTIVAFLLRRNGMATFRTFTEAQRTNGDYRSALQLAYHVSAQQLQQEWAAQLATFVQGGYQTAPTVNVDLAPAHQAIERGDYDGALALLIPLLTTLRNAHQPDQLEQARILEKLAMQGQTALHTAETARTALQQSDYSTAQAAAAEAEPTLRTLHQPQQAAVVAEYGRLAEQGLAAQAQLDLAQRQLRTLHLLAAHQTLTAAYASFAALGDNTHAGQAAAALEALNRGQGAAALFLLFLALGLVVWNGWQRRVEQRTAMPYL